jgi:hypothetical protein
VVEHTIDNIYPWGRSFDEYRKMFTLTDEDLNLKILGCADGPASFNAEMRQRGKEVVSCDPLYGNNILDALPAVISHRINRQPDRNSLTRTPRRFRRGVPRTSDRLPNP